MSMKLSRRQMLMASLGATQLGLIDGMRFPSARAQSDGGPTKLLVLYVPGGWMPSYFFSPLAAGDVERVLRPPMNYANEPAFFRPEWVKNLDGSGDADADAPIKRGCGTRRSTPPGSAKTSTPATTSSRASR
jgi:hypothetical protein